MASWQHPPSLNHPRQSEEEKAASRPVRPLSTTLKSDLDKTCVR